MILPGVTIGDWSIARADAVVAWCTLNSSVVAGVRARMIKSTDEYLEPVKKKSFKCCHLKRQVKEGVLRKKPHLNDL